MPPKKRSRTSSSTTTRRQLYTRSNRRIGRSLTAQPNGVYSFKQTLNYGTITATAADVETNFSFALSAVPQVASFTALFDAYRLDWVRVRFIPRTNTNQAGYSATVNSYTSLFLTAIDYDDIGSITTAALLEYQNVQVDNCLKPRTVTFKPKCSPQVYKVSGTTIGYAEAKPGLWIDCAYTDVPHYGLRTSLGSQGTYYTAMDVIIDYHLSFKGVR